MAYFMSWLVKRASISNSTTNNALVFYLLITMATMLGGWLIYLYSPNATGIIEAIALNMVVMTLGVVVILKYWEQGAVAKEISVSANSAANLTMTSETASDRAALEHATTLASAYVLYFLVMMASMFTIGFVYLIVSGPLGLELGLIVGTAIMTAGTIPILRRTARTNAMVNPLRSNMLKSYSVRGLLISLVLFNELLMGWAFVIASGTPSIPAGGFFSPIESFATIVGSDWFIFTMVLEMMLTIYLLRNDFQKGFIPVFILQSVVMLLAPMAIEDSVWKSFSIYTGSAAMIVLLILVFEFLYKQRMLNGPTRGYLLSLVTLYAVMMAGLFVWLIEGNLLLFSISIIGEMALYFNAALAQTGFKRTSSMSLQEKSWMSQPLWMFGFLLVTLVAEFFMAGLIDAQFYGKAFVDGFSFTPLSGSIAGIVGGSLYNFLVFFTTITASSWFYIMMGAEMGTLVVFKIKYTRELETKIRLALIVIVYAIYSIFLPFFFFSSSQLSKIPLLGWSMGIGTAGAVAPALISVIAITYLLSGGLSFLFGSRQVCSLFCTAALMYQGTFPDSMKEFNRTSKIGRKLLTSRMSGLYKTISSVVIASIIIAAAVSYLDSVGLMNVTIFGSDVAYFLYGFYFNFLWYILFISIPFMGTYACVSTGMCHWGLFNQFISRFGFFKLKVKDPQICAKCETKDCAKACPVGLTDLPSKFISSGQFKSHKCIGVGDCVSSCPYENEYIYDVRHWFGRKVGPNPSNILPQLPVIKNKISQTDQNDT